MNSFSIRGHIAISGYYFFCGNIPIKDGESSLPNNFVLCAVPEQYRLSGLHTFYVDSRQTVYRKDIQGKTITRVPLLSDYSWKAVSLKSGWKNKH